MRSSKFRFRWGAAALVSAGLAVSACGGATQAGNSAGNSTEVKTIAFAVNTQSAGQFVTLADNFVNFGKQIGIKVDVYNNNGSGPTAISNAQLMVAAKPDVIVDFPPVADATARVGDIFKASGIPCVAMNIPIPNCAFFNQSQERFAQLETDNFAKLMKQRGWDGTNTTVVIEQASEFGPTVNIAVTKFYEDMSKTIPGFQPTLASAITPQTTTISATGVQVDAGVTVDRSFTTFSQALQTIPAGRHIVIYAVSDDDIVGSYRALVNAHREGDAMMAGFGGDEHAIEGLRSNPAWVGDSDGFFTYWGEFLVAMAVGMKQGLTPPALTLSPMVVLTKDNVNNYFDAGSSTPKQMPPLPPESQWLIKTGVLQKFKNVSGLS
ncbi:hypothetical protein EPN29_03955 [bacterium]|nr:MAG: hypothetical protein EPN29_03955 [bacterium]